MRVLVIVRKKEPDHAVWLLLRVVLFLIEPVQEGVKIFVPVSPLSEENRVVGCRVGITGKIEDELIAEKACLHRGSAGYSSGAPSPRYSRWHIVRKTRPRPVFCRHRDPRFAIRPSAGSGGLPRYRAA